MTYIITRSDELYHFGIKGQKWGVRRYQNPDGTLTPEGRARYSELFESGARGDLQRYTNELRGNIKTSRKEEYQKADDELFESVYQSGSKGKKLSKKQMKDIEDYADRAVKEFKEDLWGFEDNSEAGQKIFERLKNNARFNIKEYYDEILWNNDYDSDTYGKSEKRVR